MYTSEIVHQQNDRIETYITTFYKRFLILWVCVPRIAFRVCQNALVGSVYPVAFIFCTILHLLVDFIFAYKAKNSCHSQFSSLARRFYEVWKRQRTITHYKISVQFWVKCRTKWHPFPFARRKKAKIGKVAGACFLIQVLLPHLDPMKGQVTPLFLRSEDIIYLNMFGSNTYVNLTIDVVQTSKNLNTNGLLVNLGLVYKFWWLQNQMKVKPNTAV